MLQKKYWSFSPEESEDYSYFFNRSVDYTTPLFAE